MPKRNVDQQAEITQGELLLHLERSGRVGFTKRRLTQFTSRGLLPSLRHTTRFGSNRPVYVWDQGIVEQAMDLYDVVERGHRQYHQLLLALWLRGYEVPFAPLLQRWIRLIESFLQSVTHGEHDPDTILDSISATLVEYVEPKWKFSPRPDPVIHEIGVSAWGEWMEFLFSLFVVPTYEPSEMLCEDLLTTLQSVHRIAAMNTYRDRDTSPQVSRAVAEETLSWLLSHREVFTLPRLRDTLMNASNEQWAQARKDYLEPCHLLHDFAALFPRRNARMTLEIREAVFLYCGFLLPPLFLFIRACGYGDWIDDVFAELNAILKNMLDDPDLRTLFAKM